MPLIDVFYSPRQVSAPKTSSPSPGKPRWVVEDWLEQGLPIHILVPEPVSRSQLALAHAQSYVDGVLDCQLRNGFRGFERDVADSLPWTCGSMLAAARAALESGRPTCSPTSGFHHAGYDSGHGFCTFNGLMVTALVLHAEGKVRRVGILDCDQHYGDGTADILDKLQIDWVCHVSHEYNDPSDAQPFLSGLPRLMDQFRGCDLLLYQAGADPHIRDPLGGFMTTYELQKRDDLVFATARSLGLPVAWNLAGGYQQPLSRVLDIHRNTLMAAALSQE